MEVRAVEAEDADDLINYEESHFFDVKSRDIRPSKLSQTVSAFANAQGGEIFIGIDEIRIDYDRNRTWRGFPNQEDWNDFLSMIEDIGGVEVAKANFLECDERSGFLLHLIIPKARQIVRTTDGQIYVRRGAQNLRVATSEAFRRLELQKGVVSFEDETRSVSKDVVCNSLTTIEFLLHQIPNAEPDVWLKSQFLILNDMPTVAALLLFADQPQAALPKRSAIKIFRYTTADEGIDREQLAFDPITVEGSIVDLIYEAVARTKNLVEGIKRLTEDGLEDVSYPDETLHEIITNAVLHRDYSIATDIQIRIYDDRVEVESPGVLPAHITVETILDEQFARNGKIVRIANKFPNAPNKDVGEGLNTAFEAMRKIRLQDPEVVEKENSVLVYIRHQRLASPAQIIFEYLQAHDEITNKIGREITGLRRDVQVKDQFVALRRRGLIEQVPGKRGRGSAWRLKAEE